ncbi:MAG: BspA family leucine-rich repeat surface protein [Balneolaceae bacterium]|nr:BspA family leucine-rich repeat surface protein [Balneolaceae bacterium]
MKKLSFSALLLAGIFIFAACGSNNSTPQYTLTLTASPSEGGSVSPAEQVYDKGSTANITASPSQEWVFDRWEGDYSGSSSAASVTMDADKDITAIFEKKQYALTVDTSGQGTVDEQVVSPKPTDYDSGTEVELTANPDTGWEFIEWQGDITGTANPQQLTIDEPKQVTAVFEKAFKLASNGVTITCDDASVGDTGTINSTTYTKRTAAQITPANAETTCTSGITDMSTLFDGASSFNGDISHWDVSAVTNMGFMFRDASSFNVDLSSWDVSNVTFMAAMFEGADFFNGNLSSWDVSAVTNMFGMFVDASSFNGDLSSWDVSSVTTMDSIFRGASSFNMDLSSWNVSSVTDMGSMFEGASSFNEDISTWDVSAVTNMARMFIDASSFNGDLSTWDVSGVKEMRFMFWGAGSFNGDLGSWDVSEVTDMVSMFADASSFNQDLSGWCVSNISSEPSNFSIGSPLTESNKPVWGTCPSP